MEKRPTPQFKFENEEGKEIEGEILPAVKDLKAVWHELFLDHDTLEDAESFAEHVQLFTINEGKKTEYYLILTDVKNHKANELINIFGAQRVPTPMDLFLSDVAHAKAVKDLPLSFKSETSRVYKIIS